MKIEHTMKNDILVITPQTDRLDAKDASQFKQNVLSLIASTEKFQVVFDLNKLNFIDSSGVGILLSILRFLNSRGGELKLADITPSVRTILELVSMHKIFEIFKTSDNAVSSFNPNMHSPTQ